jgi:hypothetical protein
VADHSADAARINAAELLVRDGVVCEEAPKLLGPLLRSVAENVERLGFPDALTGPVRPATSSVWRSTSPPCVRRSRSRPLLPGRGARAAAAGARALGDAAPESFDAIEVVVEGSGA